ncbi:MAG: hypothetical protein IIB61_03350 [Planctomycetes bacterium]|nr:hypothetical protein [Planctomycetota bacterium]
MPKQRCVCGQKYRFPETSIGKRAKCKKCGAVFTIVAEEPPADEGIIPIAKDDVFTQEASADPAARQRVVDSDADGWQTPEQIEGRLPDSGPSLGRAIPSSTDPVAARGYLESLAWTLLFPSSVGNLLTFLMVWFVLSLREFAATFSPFGMMMVLWFIGLLIVLGWYYAFLFSIVEGAAGGDDDLPSMTLDQGMLDGVFVPLFKFIGTKAVVMLPAFAYLFVAMSMGILTEQQVIDAFFAFVGNGSVWETLSGPAGPVVILFGIGIFLWPMVALCVALGGFGTLARMDLIVKTIVRTFPMYVVTVALVVATVIGREVTHSAMVNWSMAKAATGGGAGPSWGSFAVLTVLIQGVTIYVDIVAMRVIGLYYHHFKSRFAWNWG